eukprot:1262163-Amphidinium_carterae.1
MPGRLAQQFIDAARERQVAPATPRVTMPDRAQTHWRFTTHLLRVRRAGYESAMETLMLMLARSTLLSANFVIDDWNGLMHFYDDGVFQVRPSIAILHMPDTPGSREIMYDSIIRVAWTMGVHLWQLSLRTLSGRAAARSYTVPFTTSWMALTSFYVAVVDRSRAAIYILYPSPRPMLEARG